MQVSAQMLSEKEAVTSDRKVLVLLSNCSYMRTTLVSMQFYHKQQLPQCHHLATCVAVCQKPYQVLPAGRARLILLLRVDTTYLVIGSLYFSDDSYVVSPE